MTTQTLEQPVAAGEEVLDEGKTAKEKVAAAAEEAGEAEKTVVEEKAKEKKKEEEEEKIPLCESIGHRPLLGRCPAPTLNYNHGLPKQGMDTADHLTLLRLLGLKARI